MGLFDAAAATISSIGGAVSKFTPGGPASGMSGTVNTSTGILSGVGNLFKKIKGPKFPLLNPLHAYASYTYSIGLACLSEEEANFPDKTYMAGKRLKALICKSANADPNNRIKTTYGKFDFFIDNLVLQQNLGFAVASNNTNVTNFSFTITEPYSMGLFMIACQTAAQQQKHDNWRDAPFLLTIEFRGNKETGKMSKVPGTSRFIPFYFSNITLTATEAGSVYKCDCMAICGAALLEQNSLFKTDVSPAGRTVREILQTGEKSLQKIVNDRLQEMVTKKVVEVADQIVILFPNEIATGEPEVGPAKPITKEVVSSATVPVNPSDVYKKLGVSESTLNKTLVQQDDDSNALGKARLGFDEKRKGASVTGKENLVYNTKSSTWIRGNLTTDPSLAEMKFSQETDIPNAINQVLLVSDYSSEALDSANITAEGYRQWWRIDTQVYILNSKEQQGTGVKPKLFVYRVIPYHVHASRMMPPNTKPPGFDNDALKASVVKHYQYIYTGKNVDITRFNIEINQGFSTIMAADNLTYTRDKVTAGNTGGSDQGAKGQTAPMTAGNDPDKKIGTNPTQVIYAGTTTTTSKLGGAGSGAETPAVRAARLFQDCVTNPNEMYNLDMDIIGDPYWIAQSGLGNYTSQPVGENINRDGSVNYQTGETDILVNFRTPIDVNQNSGLYKFSGNTKSSPVIMFSGIYCITDLTSSFISGTFKQNLTGFRRPGQELSADEERAKLFSTKNPPVPGGDRGTRGGA